MPARGSVSTRQNGCEIPVFISSFTQGEEDAIHTFRLQIDSGRLVRTGHKQRVENPYFLALSVNGDFLYSVRVKGTFADDESEVVAYGIEAGSGKLEYLNRQSALGAGACYLSLNGRENTLLVANYWSGSVVSLPVAENGLLRGALRPEGGSEPGLSGRTQGVESHPHCIVASPDDRFVVVGDLGQDRVFAYRLDAVSQRLAPRASSSIEIPPRSGPRQLLFHPDGRHLYVANERSNSVILFDYQPETGMASQRQTISTLPDECECESYAADLKITPDGKLLFGSNRGHDSITVFRVETDRRLSALAYVPSGGACPQNLAITPCGRYLLSANTVGGNVAVFEIDSDQGRLTLVDEPTVVPNPACIAIRRPANEYV